MGLGAVLARGCTSGQALTGGALLSVGSWLFMIAAFAAAYAVAPFVTERGDDAPLLVGARRHRSLVAAFVIGIAFGWALERAGLGSAPKADRPVLSDRPHRLQGDVQRDRHRDARRVLAGRLGVLDLERVYVPETYLLPQLAGGLLFGVGFALAGLCPGNVVRRRGDRSRRWRSPSSAACCRGFC